MSTEPDQPAPETSEVRAGALPPWTVAELPEPPRIRWSPRGLIGPGLMMVGAAIGGGEWTMGPAVIGQYGGIFMWVAMLSIALQVSYNLEVMRYALYCGEPIFVGFFRLLPGPRFWTCVYLFIDFFGIWPYLANHAAIPVSAAMLKHLPGAFPTAYLSPEEVAERTGLPVGVVLEAEEHAKTKPKRGEEEAWRQAMPAPLRDWMDRENRQTRWIAYGVFLLALVPLFFGGKIYNSLEKVMVVKIILVFGYLLFLGFFYVKRETWAEVLAGLIFLGKDAEGAWGFRLLPAGYSFSQIDWPLIGAFAAIAGQGGMTNSQLSNYTRDKGWGMGGQVGAIPSMVGGRGIALSHTGKVFPITGESVRRWRGWLKVIYRDQMAIWFFGCILGVAIPALVSLEFVRGKNYGTDVIAAATAAGIEARTGLSILWTLTLICGFIVLFPSQISQVDGLIRRWTDVLWTGNRRLRFLEGHLVKYVYYTILGGYALWGLLVLTVIPQQAAMTKITTTFMNFALGFSALQTLAVNWKLLPPELRPGPVLKTVLFCCGLFFLTLSGLSLITVLREFGWL